MKIMVGIKIYFCKCYGGGLVQRTDTETTTCPVVIHLNNISIHGLQTCPIGLSIVAMIISK